MQRCFFLLIFFLCFNLLKAQEPDIISTELSLWLDENNNEKLHVRSLIRVNRFNLSEIVLDFIPDDINYIKLREGRLKEDLKFSHKSEKLGIETASIRTKRCEIEIDYNIDLKSRNLKNYIDQETVQLGFNLGNLVPGRSVGKAGAFFPSRDFDAFYFKANITLPRKINCGLPGELQYVVNHKGKLQSQFWETKMQINSSQFYFVLGDFLEFDEEEFQEELLMESINFEQRLAEEAKKSMQKVMAYLEKYNPNAELQLWSDKEILEIDSLAALSKPLLWVKEENTNSRWAKNQFVRDQLLFVKAAKGDSSIASLWHLEYLGKKEGEKWRLEFLQNKWEEWKDGKEENSGLALKSKILEWLSISDKGAFQKYITKDEKAMQGANWEIAKTVIQNNKIPKVEIAYFYKEQKEHLVILQKDSSLKPIPIAYNFSVFDTKGKDNYKGFSKGNFSDTLSFPQEGAPRAVIFEYETIFPADISIPKSDNYDLYLYANGENEKQKKEALFRLFETKNKNLYSTVLGLAMDYKEADIRLEAVNRAEVLGIPGQQKLKSLIMALAQNDPDPEVRKQAKLVVAKYYPKK